MPKSVKLDMKRGEYGKAFEDVMVCALKKGRFDARQFDNYINWYPSEMNRIRRDEAILTCSTLDSSESAFLARQLEYVKQKTFDIVYPEGSLVKYITVNSEADAGADAIVWRQYGGVGKMSAIGNNPDDIPRVDIVAKETSVPVKGFATSYGYTVKEIRSALYAGVPLTTRKATAARRAYDQLLNNIGWFANGGADYSGTRGLLNATGINSLASGSGGQITGSWCSPTGAATTTTVAQVISDFTQLINKSRIDSKGAEVVNRVIMPIAVEAFLSQTFVNANNGTTILKFLKDNNPGVQFSSAYELENAKIGNSTTDVVVAFNSSPDKVTFDVPLPFEQLPVQTRGLEYNVICQAYIAGVSVYYPKSVTIAKGVIDRT